jgi:3-methyladenine DNA glycosylase AlkD
MVCTSMTDGRDSHARALASTLRRLANAESGLWWQNYVKDSAPFLGVPMPAIRAAMLDWHSARIANVMAPARQVDLALRLFSGRHTEDKLAGTLLLAEVLLPAGAVRPARDLPRFAALFSRGLLYDWNACDWFCTKVLGPMIRDEATLGTDCGAAISSWRDAANLWQARASLVPFVKVADDAAHYPAIAASCRVLIARPERFAKTAVGWVLREVSRHDADFVRRALDADLRCFSAESLTNAIKYFDPTESAQWKRRLAAATHEDKR